jgi:hypothetical protein
MIFTVDTGHRRILLYRQGDSAFGYDVYSYSLQSPVWAAVRMFEHLAAHSFGRDTTDGPIRGVKHLATHPYGTNIRDVGRERVRENDKE